MNILKKTGLAYLLLLLLWLAIFDFQRILFSIHYLDKLDVSFWEWILVFFKSFHLDIATGALLSVFPIVTLYFALVFKNKLIFNIFKIIVMFEVLLVAMIHSGEINAYAEWNHKLTSRVFMHLSHPDEVFRTADISMTIWFFIYLILEVVFGWKILRWFFPNSYFKYEQKSIRWNLVGGFVLLPLLLLTSFILGRGGVQQIPINIDAAYYSKNYVLNDISVNSPYFFTKSFLLYNRSEIDAYISKMPDDEVEKELMEFYNYPKEHDNYILENKRPNLVFVILESWTSTVSEKLSGKAGATPNFDRLSEEGILFSNIYATGSTSEIGNASIFSGYPALPEISISMQPFKHRKLPTLNKDLKSLDYNSGYIFSGDLKYGNIQGYFMDHGFDDIKDEDDFPSHLEKGKLNYYDEDLYELFLERINNSSQPFLQCAFTGSTHSPYDYPKNKNLKEWEGEEKAFMNSVFYADKCLNDFLEDCKKEDWYENTLFVLVADHGHASPYVTNPSSSEFFRIPLLLYGEPLKEKAKGKTVDVVGSQVDIVKTLMHQMELNTDEYIWSKDLLNPNAPEFALHAITRGFGWVSQKGNFTYHMDFGTYIEKNYTPEELQKARKKCDAFMQAIYTDYKNL
ncbi:MAG: sulfatase-like hydrolase/transferase [Brumimicrobium sp.]